MSNYPVIKHQYMFYVLMFTTFVFVVGIGVLIGLGKIEIVGLGIILLVAGIIAYRIICVPYFGLVLVIGSLPIVDLMPSIPYFSSLVSLLGAFTFLSFILHETIHRRTFNFSFPAGLSWPLLFIIWIFITNPDAAIFSSRNDRNWISTFIQLLILAWMGGMLLNTEKKHHELLWVYSIATIISATYAIQQGVVEDTVHESIRASGLAGGINTAARYFIVAFISIYYLQETTTSKVRRWGLRLGLCLMVYGVFVTVSRTGLLLLIFAAVLLFMQRSESGKQLRTALGLSLVFLIALFFADGILSILGSTVTSIQQGSDTLGGRYLLWESGLRIWQAYPIQGVGIGQFPIYAPIYGNDILPLKYRGLGAHNMYIQILAETGIVGLSLFLMTLGTGLLALWNQMHSMPLSQRKLLFTWFVILVIILLGGATKHDHYDKLLWLVSGIGISLSQKSHSIRPLNP